MVGRSLTIILRLDRTIVRYASMRTAKDKYHLCSVLYSKIYSPYFALLKNFNASLCFRSPKRWYDRTSHHLAVVPPPPYAGGRGFALLLLKNNSKRTTRLCPADAIYFVRYTFGAIYTSYAICFALRNENRTSHRLTAVPPPPKAGGRGFALQLLYL